MIIKKFCTCAGFVRSMGEAKFEGSITNCPFCGKDLQVIKVDENQNTNEELLLG